MKTIKNDYCIRMFTGTDKLGPALTKVSLLDGYLYATNGHMGAKIKADACVQRYVAVEKYPDVEGVISEHVTEEKKTISVDVFFNDLMKIECCFKPKMISCDNCDGSGVDVCDYCDSEHDCKDCDGCGESEGTELVLTGEHDCILFNRKYKLHYLELILRTAIFTGVTEIEISNGDGVKGTIFSVGDFTILLMPLWS